MFDMWVNDEYKECPHGPAGAEEERGLSAENTMGPLNSIVPVRCNSMFELSE